MNIQIQSLLDISHYYGNNKNYVIAGGGNTSYKDESSIWIKASGTSLANITEDGLVCLSRQGLRNIYTKIYSQDVNTREEEVKQDLQSCIISPRDKRPSVETSLHDCIDYPLVVHTHPTLVNAVMCSKTCKATIDRIFGNSAIYIEYTDPGYILFKKVHDRVQKYVSSHMYLPKIIFLRNHGVFVAGTTVDEIRNIYDSIERKIKHELSQTLPDPSHISNQLETIVHAVESLTPKKASGVNSKLIQHFALDNKMFEKIANPFTPDIIVYCKSKYLFVENENDIAMEIQLFEQKNGYNPKIIIIKNKGMIALDDTRKMADTAIEVFEDMMKVSFLSEHFGGPQCMSDEQIRFIDTWEVEYYRRKMSRESV
jgi:rhamnose utilization protein RhaD (predicted bifunctional aldolase and dehydrogenase)